MRVFLGFAFLWMLAMPLAAQTIDSVPNLQTEIVVHRKIASIKAILDEISKDTGIPISSTNDLGRFQICVFTPKMKAANILRAIAQLEGAYWNPEGGGFRLTTRPETHVALVGMDAAERMALVKIRSQRLHALARLEPDITTFGEAGPAKVDSPLEDPSEWAQRMLHSPAYRVLAVACRNLESKDFDNFTSGLAYMEFRASPPPDTYAASCGLFLRQPLASSEEDLNGVQILALAVPNSAAFECAPVVSATLNTYVHPVVDFAISPIPPDQFASSAIGPLIAGWTVDLTAPPDSALSQSASVSAPSVPPYEGGAFTQADQLEAFADSTHIPVITDASRLKGVVVAKPSDGSPLQWLNSFRSLTSGFARVSDGVVLFRQKRFWKLRDLDISEPLIQALEEQRRTKMAGFDEYAAFAAGITVASGEQLVNLDPVIFQSFREHTLIYSDDYLLRFPRILFRDAMPALVALGWLSAAEHYHLTVNHGFVIWGSKITGVVKHRISAGFWVSPFYRTQLNGFYPDALLSPHPPRLDPRLLYTLGYTRDYVLHIDHMVFPSHVDTPFLLLLGMPIFGCDNAEIMTVGKTSLLVNRLDLWTGYDAENRIRFSMTLP